MAWKSVILGDHCTITSSKRFHASERTTTGVPFYCSKEIIQKVHGEDVTECDYISEEAYENVKIEYGVPETGDLLITSRGTYGVPYLYRNSDKFYFADGNLTWLKDFDEELDAKYFFYWVQSYEGQQKIDAIAKGTAQKAIPISTLKTVELTIPDSTTQKKIASILSAYEDLIENNQKQIKLLEEAAQRLYKEWFVDLRFPGHENVKIVDGVPEGWKRRELSKVLSYIRGRSYSSEDLGEQNGILLVNLKNIRAYGGYNYNSEKHFLGKYNDNQILSAGDIIMAVTDMTQERRLVGHVAIVPCLNRKAIFSMDLIRLIPFEATKSYLYSIMNYGNFSKKISMFANGVNVLHLKPDTIMDMEMLIPSDELMYQYDDFFEKIRNKIEILQKQIEKSQEALDRLLPKLISGEIQV